jgi:hypothetical protein
MSVQKQFFAPLLFLPYNNKKPADDDDDDGVTANETQTVLKAHQNQNPSLLEEGFQVRDLMNPGALAENFPESCTLSRECQAPSMAMRVRENVRERLLLLFPFCSITETTAWKAHRTVSALVLTRSCCTSRIHAHESPSSQCRSRQYSRQFVARESEVSRRGMRRPRMHREWVGPGGRTRGNLVRLADS